MPEKRTEVHSERVEISSSAASRMRPLNASGFGGVSSSTMPVNSPYTAVLETNTIGGNGCWRPRASSRRAGRSEERRVGKEGRSRWAPCQHTQKQTGSGDKQASDTHRDIRQT